MIFGSSYINIVSITLQNSGGKVVFLKAPWNPPPMGNNVSKNTLVT